MKRMRGLYIDSVKITLAAKLFFFNNQRALTRVFEPVISEEQTQNLKCGPMSGDSLAAYLVATRYFYDLYNNQ